MTVCHGHLRGIVTISSKFHFSKPHLPGISSAQCSDYSEIYSRQGMQIVQTCVRLVHFLVVISFLYLLLKHDPCSTNSMGGIQRSKFQRSVECSSKMRNTFAISQLQRAAEPLRRSRLLQRPVAIRRTKYASFRSLRFVPTPRLLPNLKRARSFRQDGFTKLRQFPDAGKPYFTKSTPVAALHCNRKRTAADLKPEPAWTRSAELCSSCCPHSQEAQTSLPQEAQTSLHICLHYF